MFKFDNTLMRIVQKDLENNCIPMLLGDPGIGKSSWVEGLAKLMNTKCFTLACNQLADKADLTGARLVPCGQDANGNTKYKQMFYPHAVIQDACEYASAHPHEFPILFLDELNRTTPDVTSEALSIPTMRKIGSVELPVNLRVVTAGNDKGNITCLDEASITRFCLYHVAPDVDTFIAVNPELNEFIRRVLNAHRTENILFCRTLTVAKVAPTDDDDDKDQNQMIDTIIDESEEMTQTTTPRTISALSRWLNSCDNQELQQLLAIGVPDDNDPSQEIPALKAVIESHVGRTNFSQILFNEIVNGITTVQNQTNVVSIQKPAIYDIIKAQPDLNALNQLISSSAKNELAAAFAYMLTEHEDNRVFLTALAPALDSPDIGPYFLTLQTMKNANRVDLQNLNVAVNAASGNLVVVLNMLEQN